MSQAALLNDVTMHRPVPDDDALPHLAFVLDENNVRPLLAAALHAPVAQASVRYLRYKPGTRCLVLYRAELEAGGSAYAYARLTSIEAERQDSSEGALWLPDLRLEIVPARADRRIRGLRALVDKQQRMAMLERLVREDRRAGYESGWGQWDMVRYKPERRAVLAGTTDAGGRYFVRLYAGKQGERKAQTVRALRNTLAQASGIGHGLRYSQTYRALLTNEAVGDSLASFSTGAADGGRALRAAAVAIRELHLIPASLVAGSPVRPDESAAHAAAALGAILPDTQGEASGLANEIVRRLQPYTEPLCLIHGDFDDSQFLVEQSGTVQILDFDEARPGYAVEDVASFIARLLGRSDSHADSVDTATRSAREFVTAYERARGWDLPKDQLFSWTALSLLQLAVEPFRRFQYDWPQRSQEILHLAGKALRGELL